MNVQRYKMHVHIETNPKIAPLFFAFGELKKEQATCFIIFAPFSQKLKYRVISMDENEITNMNKEKL